MVPKPVAWLAIVLFAAAPVARARPARQVRPRVAGLWETPGGRVELTRVGDKVTGVLTAPVAGSPLDTGLVVLQGTFYEDNVTATVRLGLVAQPCGAIDQSGFAMLLLTRSGKLTGSLASRATCATGVSSLLFTRSKDQSAAGKKARPRAPPPPPDFGLYDDPSHERPDTVITEMLAQGLALAKAGRYEAARKLFLKATREAPNRGEAYNGVGATYAMRNDYENAIDWYKTGLEHAPGFSDLYFNLACAYAQLGKTEMAMRYLRLAALKGYGQPKMLDDPDLDPLRRSPEFTKLQALMSLGAPASP